jgi:hypothetical protein
MDNQPTRPPHDQEYQDAKRDVMTNKQEAIRRANIRVVKLVRVER